MVPLTDVHTHVVEIDGTVSELGLTLVHHADRLEFRVTTGCAEIRFYDFGLMKNSENTVALPGRPAVFLCIPQTPQPVYCYDGLWVPAGQADGAQKTALIGAIIIGDEKMPGDQSATRAQAIQAMKGVKPRQ